MKTVTNTMGNGWREKFTDTAGFKIVRREELTRDYGRKASFTDNVRRKHLHCNFNDYFNIISVFGFKIYNNL